MRSRLAALLAALNLISCAPATVTVVMNAANNSGQSGTATLTDLGGSTRVVILLHASEFGEKQPAHFHKGRCGEIGPRLDLDAGAKTIGLSSLGPADPANMTGVPKTDGGFAASSSEVFVPLSELTTGDWVINVHDAQDFSLYVSCGNIN